MYQYNHFENSVQMLVKLNMCNLSDLAISLLNIFPGGYFVHVHQKNAEELSRQSLQQKIKRCLTGLWVVLVRYRMKKIRKEPWP